MAGAWQGGGCTEPYLCSPCGRASRFPPRGLLCRTHERGLYLGQLDLGPIPAFGEEVLVDQFQDQPVISQRPVRQPRASLRGRSAPPEPRAPKTQREGQAPPPPRRGSRQLLAGGVAQLPGVHPRVPVSGRLLRPGYKYQPRPHVPQRLAAFFQQMCQEKPT